MKQDPTPAPHTPASAFVAANRWALVGLMGAIAALVIVNVIARYAFGKSFPWVEEASRYGMIWAAFLGAGPALRVGGHIAVESLVQALPPRAAVALRALLVALMAATLAAMVWLGWDYAVFAWEQESPVLGWSLGMVYLAIPVGAALALVHLLLVAREWTTRGEWERVEGFDPQAM
jgi:TRAP-type C4-dicarboxylate transport system permease small subunit